jgi:2-dehydropantoate 2-reductase
MATVAILGPGGVGGFLAGALARAGERVTVVARESTAELIAHQGLEISSVRLGDFSAHPDAVARLTVPPDFLLVATKATGLKAALERIEAAPRLLVPLLNGLDHMSVLRERYGGCVAAGVIRIEADRPVPGRIVQTSPFLRIDLAADDPELIKPLAQLSEILTRTGIPVRLGRSEAEILWTKLVRLTALALTTSAYDVPLGAIRTEHRPTLEACIAETAAVATAEGAGIDPAGPLAELDDAHAELGSSMRRDIAAGREPELDAIAGSVLRAGARHGLACPTIARLADEVAGRAGIPAPAP